MANQRGNRRLVGRWPTMLVRCRHGLIPPRPARVYVLSRNGQGPRDQTGGNLKPQQIMKAVLVLAALVMAVSVQAQKPKPAPASPAVPAARVAPAAFAGDKIFDFTKVHRLRISISAAEWAVLMTSGGRSTVGPGGSDYQTSDGRQVHLSSG